MVSSSKKSKLCSKAGKIGSSARWQNHVSIPTCLVRIQKNDADTLIRLASLSRSTVGAVVHSLLEHSCDYLRTSKCSQINS